MKGKEQTCLTVHVHPRARRRRVEKVGSGEYKIHVLAPPFKGEANKEVIETLATHFDLSPSQVKIVKGFKSRRKIIVLEME